MPRYARPPFIVDPASDCSSSSSDSDDFIHIPLPRGILRRSRSATNQRRDGHRTCNISRGSNLHPPRHDRHRRSASTGADVGNSEIRIYNTTSSNASSRNNSRARRNNRGVHFADEIRDVVDDSDSDFDIPVLIGRRPRGRLRRRDAHLDEAHARGAHILEEYAHHAPLGLIDNLLVREARRREEADKLYEEEKKKIHEKVEMEKWEQKIKLKKAEEKEKKEAEETKFAGRFLETIAQNGYSVSHAQQILQQDRARKARIENPQMLLMPPPMVLGPPRGNADTIYGTDYISPRALEWYGFREGRDWQYARNVSEPVYYHYCYYYDDDESSCCSSCCCQ